MAIERDDRCRRKGEGVGEMPEYGEGGRADHKCNTDPKRGIRAEPDPNDAIQWRVAFGFVIWISRPRQYRFSPFAAVAIMFAAGVQADRNAL